MLKKKKGILEFCYIIRGQGSIPAKKWLEKNSFLQEDCGLINIPHMRDMYGLYHSNNKIQYKGIVKSEHSNDVQLSSIPKGEKPIAYLSFNKDGYIKYCKDYKEYWDWVEKRSEARYENTISSGKNYDAKNMMHTFRLLDMAEEILKDQKINVRRKNRKELLDIRKGQFEYDDLILQAEEKINIIHQLWKSSALPEAPDKENANALLMEIRKKWYLENK